MRFEFATATRIVFGPGTLREVGPLAREFGPRVLVVTGADPRRAEPLLAVLRQHSVSSSSTFPVPGEPEIETVRQGVALAKQENCGAVIAFGGGSAWTPAKPSPPCSPTRASCSITSKSSAAARRCRTPPLRSSRSPPPPAPAPKSPATPCSPRRRTASRSACAARSCCQRSQSLTRN